MIYRFEDQFPRLASSVFVAPSADIIGDVEIENNSNIWFQVLIRGDVNTIRIGERTNIQDHSCLHVTRKTAPLKIGSDVTVGHRALLHGCSIDDRVLIGMGAILMDGAIIRKNSLVAAGSLVSPGKEFPEGKLIMGSPAKVIRDLNETELRFLNESAANYVKDSKAYSSISIWPDT